MQKEWEGDILYVWHDVTTTTRGPVRAQLQQHVHSEWEGDILYRVMSVQQHVGQYVHNEWEGDILYVSCDVSITTHRPVRAQRVGR